MRYWTPAAGAARTRSPWPRPGCRSWAWTFAETAIARAREKAADRGIGAEFAIVDAFELQRIGRTFDAVLDCGLLHTFDAEEEPSYVASLGRVTRPGSRLHLLCFSDEGEDLGPHPVGRAELETTFNEATGWSITSLEPARIETNFHDNGASRLAGGN